MAKLSSVVIATFSLISVAIVAPMLAADSNPPAAEPPPPHLHKHRHLPTPAPTPMALPPEVKAKVPAYKPGPIPFHDGEQLVYEATWVGIPAAQARLEFHKSPKDPSQWIGEIWIETNAFADLWNSMRACAAGIPAHVAWNINCSPS